MTTRDGDKPISQKPLMTDMSSLIAINSSTSEDSDRLNSVVPTIPTFYQLHVDGALLVKNNYLEILMLVQMEVTMKTVA